MPRLRVVAAAGGAAVLARVGFSFFPARMATWGTFSRPVACDEGIGAPRSPRAERRPLFSAMESAPTESGKHLIGQHQAAAWQRATTSEESRIDHAMPTTDPSPPADEHADGRAQSLIDRLVTGLQARSALID
ncbi:unnamed protein product, partial [Phaeothamnion confervicola]